MFELKPDFEAVFERYEAWWHCAVLDRPLVSITVPVPEDERAPLPRGGHASLRERWLDSGYAARAAAAQVRNTAYVADALPVAWPNLGPEVFSAFYGCELIFGEDTSWSTPILQDWSEKSLNALQFDPDNFYFRKLLEMMDALLEEASGRFIAGYTDLHGGGDALAALRDPQTLLMDTIERPEAVKALCERITNDFLRVYDLFHEKLSAAGMPSTTWLPATGSGKYHVPSCDISCMISEESFENLFVPGIERECQHMDRCIYHLDGPGALRFLDCILEIPSIHAVQWVPGAGQPDWTAWLDVYRRIQDSGKALEILSVSAEELPLLFESLRPEGVWLGAVSGISTREEAEAVLRQVARWTRKR